MKLYFCLDRVSIALEQFQVEMLKIMSSQSEVNNNKVLGVDDYESSQEMSRIALVENIEKRGFEEEQGGEDQAAVNLAMVAVQEKEGKVAEIGTALSMEEVDMNETDLVEDVKTDRNLYEKGRGNDFGGTAEVESVLFEETKTEGNLIEKRQAVMFEVTDESLLNKKLDVADDLSTDDTVSVLELDSKAVKNFEEKEDEVSRHPSPNVSSQSRILAPKWGTQHFWEIHICRAAPLSINAILPICEG